MKLRSWKPVVHMYLMLTSVVGIVLFLFAFFPIKHALSTSESLQADSCHHECNRSHNGTRLIGRLVFMVIDALRADFVLSKEAATNMPYLTRLVQQGRACTYTATANPPTVTMPRIKAMVTGTVPGFVDIILNLGSSAIVEDSFVSQLVDSGQKAILYGDDTWLKLFPNTFSRSDGTTSFFVTDYTEVDVNVTRHLSKELEQRDWSLMVLHYLGLDHIGHLVGPRSSLVPPKLQEMDNIIQQIHLVHNDGLPQVLVVCGDHGMKDSGSHGGASHAETRVAVAVLGLPCESSDREIAQVDLAPTLSVLQGLPIPRHSVGTLISEILVSLSPEQRLKVLQENAAHLVTLLHTTLSPKQESLYLEAKQLHSEWLQNPRAELHERVSAMYETASNDMSSSLATSHTSFDLYALAVTYFLIIQCFSLLCIFLAFLDFPKIDSSIFPNIDCGPVVLLFLFFTGLNAILCSIMQQGNSLMCDVSSRGIYLPFIISAALAFNTSMLYNSFKHLGPSKIPGDWIEIFLFFGTILHSLGLGASSLVEEEHQVWYFLWTTLLFMLLYQNNVILFATCLVLHMIFRKLNQTGDKWAHLPDIEDWLAERKDLTTLVFIIAILCIGVYVCINKTKRLETKLITTLALVFIYLYRAALDTVEIPFLRTYLSNQGWLESQLFGWCLVFLLSRGLSKALYIGAPSLAIQTLRDCWILGSAILRRPHDVILLPVLIFASTVINKTLHLRTLPLAVAHVWLGWVSYFYQGNSNSLASIDVAAGYVGLFDYQPSLVGTFLMAHTYSAPVLSQLMLMSWLIQNRSKREMHRGLLVCSVLRLLPAVLYLVIVVVQREHLFIWSVFAPKLLYEATATFVSFLSLLLCMLCLF